MSRGMSAEQGSACLCFLIQAKLVDAPISHTCAGARTQEGGGAAPGLGAAGMSRPGAGRWHPGGPRARAHPLSWLGTWAEGVTPSEVKFVGPVEGPRGPSRHSLWCF